MEEDQSILDRLVDGAGRIVENIASLEWEVYKAERLADLRDVEEMGREEQIERHSGTYVDNIPREKAIIGTTAALSIGMLIVAAALIARG